MRAPRPRRSGRGLRRQQRAALSEAAYQQQGGAICTRYQSAIRKLGQPTKVAQLGPFITKAMPILTRTVADLGTIHPPDESVTAGISDDARQTVTRAQAPRAAAARPTGPRSSGC